MRSSIKSRMLALAAMIALVSSMAISCLPMSGAELFIATTVSALIASGQVAQITYHHNRAMDNGLTQSESSEVLNHLAFYVGWPKVFSALPVAKEVFEKRPE